MEEFMKDFIVYFIAGATTVLTFFLLERKRLKKIGLDKYHEIIQIVAPKGTTEKLKAYALIKGYKNEQELIAKLINDEIIKDSEKLNK